MFFEVMVIKIDRVKHKIKEDNKMTEQEKLDLLEEIMDVEEALAMDDVLEEIEEWDSLSTLALAAKVKEMYNRNLTAQEIMGFKTVRDICDYLND